ncbi:TasA family protein [Mesobacillus maritimus]|uniref:TasA family protein n=1 Tax=Mesobacillus maritimus TaxID=1643336 RepID=UPI00384CF34D
MKLIPPLLLIFVLLFPIGAAANINNGEIDLTTRPAKILFDLSNVKPGDSVARDFVIINNGIQDFNYITSSKFLSGSEHFYNQLDLMIEDANGILYEGKLKDLTGLEPKFLEGQQSENLLFVIKVPIELGNEFQGVSTEFQLKLFVEGTLGGVLPADGPMLPNTATDMFNLIIAGAVLVLGGGIYYFKNKRKIADIKK